MWGKAPIYTVLYNVWASDTALFPKYGMYWSKGISIYSSPLSPEPERVSGWEFLDIEESDELYRHIEEPCSGVVEDNDFSRWPRPGSSQS
jgi:hypothetical protein